MKQDYNATDILNRDQRISGRIVKSLGVGEFISDYFQVAVSELKMMASLEFLISK